MMISISLSVPSIKSSTYAYENFLIRFFILFSAIIVATCKPESTNYA